VAGPLAPSRAPRFQRVARGRVARPAASAARFPRDTGCRALVPDRARRRPAHHAYEGLEATSRVASPIASVMTVNVDLRTPADHDGSASLS